MTSWLARLKAWWDELGEQSPVLFVILRMVKRFQHDEGNTQAASMAYFLLFSIFPLLLLVINAGSLLVSPERAQELAFGLVRNFPESVRDLVSSNIASALAMRGTVTWISLLALAWSSMQIFFALVGALNKVRDVPENRSFLHLRLIAFLTVLASLFMVFLSVLLDTISAVLGALTRALGIHELPTIGPWIGQVLPSLFTGSSMLLSFVLLLALYRGVPAQPRPLVCLWPGALFGTFGWQLSKAAFAWYLSTVPSQTAVYGSVGTLITLLLWLYVSSMVILLGGELNESLLDWRRKAHAS